MAVAAISRDPEYPWRYTGGATYGLSFEFPVSGFMRSGEITAWVCEPGRFLADFFAKKRHRPTTLALPNYRAKLYFANSAPPLPTAACRVAVKPTVQMSTKPLIGFNSVVVDVFVLWRHPFCDCDFAALRR